MQKKLNKYHFGSLCFTKTISKYVCVMAVEKEKAV